MLAFDEGWRLWPLRNLRKAMPHRINWIMAELLNQDIPVAIVSTPQFTTNQETLVQSSGWSDEQLIGRLTDYKRLPDALSDEDLQAVARAVMPNGCATSLRILVTYARASKRYLAGIQSLAKRARFMARNDGRSEPLLTDLSRALKEGQSPSDDAIARTLLGRRKTPGSRSARAIQSGCKASAEQFSEQRESRGFSPAEPAQSGRLGTAAQLLPT